jgi:membrane protein implicated in regulation of membrane protease activity
MRTVFALLSAIWLIGAAILIGDGRFGASGEPPNETPIGDPGVMAMYFLGRIAFAGVGLLALSLIDWAAARRFLPWSPTLQSDGD